MNKYPEFLKPVICAAFLFLLVPTSYSNAMDQPAREANESTERSSVKSLAREEIQKISTRIDALVLEQLLERQQSFNEPASDEIFLRRIYLDVVGRIPTLEETTDFLQSPDQHKCADLIDKLLDSYGYVSRQFNFYADLLRVKSRDKNIIGQPYIDYIKDSLAENKPYDEFVRELLTAEGPMMQKGNGQVGYFLRDVAMPEDNMSNTIRIFLGTRLECAQCHDHPFDKWTQRQYYEMVAFTGGMSYRPRRPDSEYSQELMALRRKKGQIEPELFPILRNIIQPMTYGIQGSGTGLARLPEGFMGDDGEESEIIKGKTMFGELSLVDAKIPELRRPNRVGKNPQIIPGAREVNSRARFAEWLTDPENPRFAQVIANRLWKQALGLGLIEPVDVIEDSTVASNPARWIT